MPKTAVAKKKEASGCTPFSVEVAVLPEDNREIRFGISRGCNADNTAFWVLDFQLSDIVNGNKTTRVEIHVRVGAEKESKVEALADNKQLTASKLNLLQGRIADLASELPAGTTDNEELKKLLLRLLN